MTVEEYKALKKAFLRYEVCSSWWAGWIWFDWGQELAAKYMVRKVTRKMNRYIESNK